MKVFLFAVLVAYQICDQAVRAHNELKFVSEADGIEHRFFIGSVRASWFQARRICSDLNMKLLSITSPEIQKFVTKLISRFGHQNEYFWTGGNDLANFNEFYWEDDRPLEYTNWRSAPQECTAGNCIVQLHCNEEFKWLNMPCSNIQYFVCQSDVYNLQSKEHRFRTITSTPLGLTLHITNFAMTYPAAETYCSNLNMDIIDVAETTVVPMFIASALNEWGIQARKFWNNNATNSIVEGYRYANCTDVEIRSNGDTEEESVDCYIPKKIICAKYLIGDP